MRKVKKSIFPKILLWFIIVLILATVAVAFYVDKKIDKEMDLGLIRTGSSSITKIYYFDYENRSVRAGEARELDGGEIFLQRSEWCSFYSMPDSLANAFLAVEDHRFYDHKGVDWLRTGKAALNYIFKFDKSGYGGSTITQQLIKNLTGDNSTTPRRKTQEVFRALNLEKKLGKNEILELYLNVVYLSENCYGVGSAAKLYFGKEVSELTIAECASLASIVKNPYKYDPYRFPENNLERRRVVLSQMLKYGMITKEEYEQSYNENLSINEDIEKERSNGIYSWYTEALLDDVSTDLANEYGISKKAANMMIMKGGLNIYSTIDPKIQKCAEQIYENYSAYIYPQENGKYPSSACVILDPQTSDVLAIVGDIGKKKANLIFNHATSAKRSPGSAIKPLSVYAPAIDSGCVTYSTVFDDTPYNFSNGTPWPKNSPNVYRGLITVNYAVVHSVNTTSVKLLDKLGIDYSYGFLTEKFRLSLNKKDKAEAPLALGQLTCGESVLNMTNAYCAFANGGYMNTPKTYLYVTDNYGNVILSKENKKERVISGAAACVVTQMLKNVVKEGTAKGMKISEMVDVAGKTGTTSDSFDKWFIGYTPYYVCGVWCGFDTPEPLRYSTNPSCRFFDEIMSLAHSDIEEYKEFSVSPDVIKVEFCEDSGLLPCEYCRLDPRGERICTGYFIKGTEPTERCNIHKPVTIDVRSGMEATPFTPHYARRIISLLDYERDLPYDIKISDSEYLISSIKQN